MISPVASISTLGNSDSKPSPPLPTLGNADSKPSCCYPTWWCDVTCRSIAQGCSEYNITVLIDGKDSVRALRAVHSRFYLATLPLAVGIVGPGAIGSTFMRQLMQQKEVCCH